MKREAAAILKLPHCAERLQSLLTLENMLVILCLSDELRVASLRAAALAFCGENFAVLPKEEAGAFMQNHTELALEVFHLAAGRGAYAIIYLS